MINAHTQDDFFLFDETTHPIKTQTLMWYLEQTSKDLHSCVDIAETGKDWIYEYNSPEQKLKAINSTIKDKLRILDQLIKRLQIDEVNKISHISATLKGWGK